MHQIRKIFLTLTIILSSQTIFAASDQQQTQCPSVNALKQAGISFVERDRDDTWHGCREDKLGTKAMWMVIVGPVKANTDAAALKKANAALAALVFKSESNGPPWSVCEYEGQFEGKEIFWSRHSRRAGTTKIQAPLNLQYVSTSKAVIMQCPVEFLPGILLPVYPPLAQCYPCLTQTFTKE